MSTLEAEHETITKPLPQEVWALRFTNTGKLLPPMDDDGCEQFMAFPTYQDAAIAMGSQYGKGYLDADDEVEIVQLK